MGEITTGVDLGGPGEGWGIWGRGLPGGQNAPGPRGSIFKLFRSYQLPYMIYFIYYIIYYRYFIKFPVFYRIFYMYLFGVPRWCHNVQVLQ